MSEDLIAVFTNPTLWVVVLVWTAIGVINKTIYYEAGQRSGKAALEKIHGYTRERADRFHSQYDRWGSSLLSPASIPVFGSVIAAMAGMDAVKILVFIVLVAISSLVHNWLIIFFASGLSEAMAGFYEFTGDILAIILIGLVIGYGRILVKHDPELTHKYKTCLVISFVAPSILCPVFKYFLLVPLPFEGMATQLMEYIRYGDE